MSDERRGEAPRPTMRYGPGAGTCIAGSATVVLIGVAPHDDVVGAIASAVLDGADLLDVAGVLLAQRIADEVPVAVLAAEGSRLIALLHGSVQLTATDAAGTVATHDGIGARTWREIDLASEVVDTTLDPTAQGATLPLVGGVVPAGAVRISTRAEVPTGPARSDAVAAPAPPPPVAEVEAEVEHQAPAPSPALAADDAPLEPPTTIRGARAPAPPAPPARVEPVISDPGPTPASVAPVAPSGSPDDDEDRPTIVRDRSDAAVTSAPSDSPPPRPAGGLISAAPGMTAASGDLGGAAAVESAPAPSEHLPPDPPPTPALPTAVSDEETRGDGLDASTTARGAAAPPPRAPAPVADGPTVQAVRCASGHASSPHAERCRVCDSPIEDRTVHTVARPVMARLVLPDGSEVALDRPAVLGRRPPADIEVDGEAALPVQLADDDKMLSRSHVEIRLRGWQIQVIDLDSMNHTVVEIPGQAPMQLRPGEATPVPLGTILDLADSVRVHLLAATR